MSRRFCERKYVLCSSYFCITRYSHVIIFSMLPHNQGGTPHATSVTGGGGDQELERIRNREQKAQLENRLRIMKNDIVDKQRTFHVLERDVQELEMSMHHVEEETGRIGGEYKRMAQIVQKTEAESKSAANSYREKENELHRKEDEVQKYEREIQLLKTQVSERERKIVFIKQDISKLMREKEDFRRLNELDHFSAMTESEHAREKSSRIQSLAQEEKRKRAEMERKKQTMAEIRRYVIDKEQDIMQLDAQIRRMAMEMR